MFAVLSRQEKVRRHGASTSRSSKLKILYDIISFHSFINYHIFLVY
jgi:hypothetical protein